MAYHSPKRAFHFRTFSLSKVSALSFFLGALLLSAGAMAGGEPAAEAEINLKPYHATYHITKDSIVAEVKRALQRLPGDRWQLSDSARILFFSLEESAEIRLDDQQITPLHYRHRQSPGKSKNQDIHYDWEQRSARVELDDKTRHVPLDQPSYDKLSLQLQLRLDLLTGQLERPQSYRLIDRGRIKHYRIEKIGEEILTIGKRQIQTVKLRQHSEGKDKETFIWTAPDLDYLIVRIVHEDDDERYEMRLESASLVPSKP